MELIGKKGFLTKAQDSRREKDTRLPVSLHSSPQGTRISLSTAYGEALPYNEYDTVTPPFVRHLELSRV